MKKKELSPKDKKILQKEIDGIVSFLSQKIEDEEKLAIKLAEIKPVIDFFINFLISCRDGETLTEFGERLRRELNAAKKQTLN